MAKIVVGIVSAADFERAKRQIPDLSDWRSYEDWLDARQGRFMGLSLGGADAILTTVALVDFLQWCAIRDVPPSEAALDACAAHMSRAPRKALPFGIS